MAVIRQANDGDILRLLELYRQLSLHPEEYHPASPGNCRRILEEISRLPGYELLVAEEGGEVVGTATLAILPGLAHGTSPFAVVEYVVVDERHRRRGIGRLLMEYIIKRAAQAGCYKIMLTSDNRRHEAHDFYRSLGFEASAHGFRLYFPPASGKASGGR